MAALPTLELPVPVARAMLYPFFRMTLHRRVPWPVQRALLNAVSLTQPLPAGTEVSTLTLGGRRAERVTAGTASAAPGAVLYLHGGGYTVGSAATHRSLAAHLAEATGRPVYLLDYRLAPEHPCPAGLEDALAAVAALTDERGHAPGSIVLGGDSAGGGIALATAQWLVARPANASAARPAASESTAPRPANASAARPAGASESVVPRPARPAALVLLSPWADPRVVAERRRDLIVSRDWGLSCAAAYLGAGDPDDPRYAPASAPMAGLPPTYLHANTRELLHPQIVALAVELRRAKVPLRYVESDTLWHAAQVQAGLVRQAADSLRDVAAFLADAWSSSSAAV